MMHLKVRFPKPIEYRQIAAFIANCKSVFSLSDLDFSYCYPPETFNTLTLTFILPELSKLVPAVNGFLNDAEYEDDGVEILVSLHHGGKEVLENANAHAKLSQLLSQRFNITREVTFFEAVHVDDQSEDYIQIQSAIRELRVAQPEPEPIAPEKEELEYADLPITLKDAKAIYGHSQIRSKPQTIRSVTTQSGTVVVWGDVFGLETLETRDGKRMIITYNITDYTSSYTVKIFEAKENCEELLKDLKNDVTILMRGTVRDDEFLHTSLINAKAITLVKKVPKKDNAPVKRVELHLHTNMSAMDGMTSAENLVKRAAEWGHKAIAITDHGCVQAFPEAMLASKATGVKIIYGMEGYLVDDQVPVSAVMQKRLLMRNLLFSTWKQPD